MGEGLENGGEEVSRKGGGQRGGKRSWRKRVGQPRLIICALRKANSKRPQTNPAPYLGSGRDGVDVGGLLAPEPGPG